MFSKKQTLLLLLTLIILSLSSCLQPTYNQRLKAFYDLIENQESIEAFRKGDIAQVAEQLETEVEASEKKQKAYKELLMQEGINFFSYEQVCDHFYRVILPRTDDDFPGFR